MMHKTMTIPPDQLDAAETPSRADTSIVGTMIASVSYQARILFNCSREGLLPELFGNAPLRSLRRPKIRAAISHVP
jgi:hypothetical protein